MPIDTLTPAAKTQRMRRYLRFLGADHDAAQDLAQEALLAGLHQWSDGNAPLAWLLGTARNLFRKQLRTVGRRRELVDADRLHELWQQHVVDDGESERAALRECLANLPERSRQVIAWRYGEGLPRDDIANRLGLGSEGVKSLLQRVRTALGDCVRRRMS
ncbi:MAG: sigma-70 family RNA polymerase sigma factor [bacterium]|nr:sigma-70 family RNA polymerase sigma factor [bacterium]